MEQTPRRREGKSGKERILDAAELLFAQHGFDGVSVRDITEAAHVDVALVSYHFGGKRELFAALFQRRAEYLNAARMLCLDAAIEAARPSPPTVDAVIGSYLQPMVDLSMGSDPGWRSYFAIVAQVNNSARWAPVLMSQHFDPSAARLIEALGTALPECPAEDIFWAIMFLAGSMTLTFAQTGRIERLSGGACSSADLVGAMRRLVPYAAAGFRALAGEATGSVTSTISEKTPKVANIAGKRVKRPKKSSKNPKKS